MDGPIAQEFLNENNKLIPIILSHGLMASRMLYTTIGRELASHGYIVFSPDHHDGSNHYTEDKDGNPVRFDLSTTGMKGEPYYENMCQKVKIRENEVRELIDEISDASYP